MDPTILVAYIAVANGERTERCATRFVHTWLANMPGAKCHLMVICNGGPISHETGAVLKLLDPQFFVRKNDGADIGGFIDLATHAGCDLMLCCGESVYFHRPGWISRLSEVWKVHGPGMYGFYSSNLVTKHLNTTCFAVSPHLLRGWNQKVETKEQRYEFEHGAKPFWKQVEALGRPVRLVMWDHDLAPWQWRTTENEFWRGDQSQCLMWCSHTDRFQNAVKGTRTMWTNNADRGLPEPR